MWHVKCSGQTAESHICLVTAVLTVRMHHHRLVKNDMQLLRFYDLKAADIFMLACDQKWKGTQTKKSWHALDQTGR